MVYLQDFEEFQMAAQNLFVKDPLRTRFACKYRHKDARTILKVTNNRICIKFKTCWSSDVKQIEKFCQSYARWMVTKRLQDIDEKDEELEDAKDAAKKQSETKRRRRKG
mmetsp:Transcript_41632/g.73111  ORF Transcript_41632/g.73111 Transcript_41632/m.73111 type:complete len:109 (-) Transcript_41632:176-502(-)